MPLLIRLPSLGWCLEVALKVPFALRYRFLSAKDLDVSCKWHITILVPSVLWKIRKNRTPFLSWSPTSWLLYYSAKKSSDLNVCIIYNWCERCCFWWLRQNRGASCLGEGETLPSAKCYPCPFWQSFEDLLQNSKKRKRGKGVILPICTPRFFKSELKEAYNYRAIHSVTWINKVTSKNT